MTTKKKRVAKQDPASLDVLEREYRDIRSIAGDYCHELVDQVGKLLTMEGITLGFPVQSRVKAWDSLARKVEQQLPGISSVREVQDLVGLRLILLFGRDVTKVHDLIGKHFRVTRQYNTQERLKEDQFGYASEHFVVELPEEWLAVPTLAPFRGLQAEIQVRTLAQHTWAEASQALQYKQEESVPPSIRRAMYRVSAVLEMVDLEFERVLDERDAYRAGLAAASSAEELNVDLLERTLDTVLPESNKEPGEETYSELLADLFGVGIRTPGQLKEIIERHIKAVLAIDVRAAETVRTGGRGYEINERNRKRAAEGFYFAHVGLVRSALRLEFGDA